MLRYSELEKNSIELEFCEPFQKLRLHPMDEETTKILIQLLFASKNVIIPEDEKPFLYKLIEKRLTAYTYTITDTRLIFFLIVISRTPGKAVMYMTYLQYWSKKHGVKDIALDDFAKEIFPMGFPSDDDLRILWDKCKVTGKPKDLTGEAEEFFYDNSFIDYDKERQEIKGGSDNLLDYRYALTSIL